jgi:hypothetical protein
VRLYNAESSHFVVKSSVPRDTIEVNSSQFAEASDALSQVAIQLRCREVPADDIVVAIRAKLDEEEQFLFEEIGAAFIEVPLGASAPKPKELIKAGIDAIRRAQSASQPYICGNDTIRRLAASHRMNTAVDLTAAIYDCLADHQIAIFGAGPLPIVAVSVIFSRMLLFEFCSDYWFRGQE